MLIHHWLTSLQVAEELLKTKTEEEETEAAGYEGMEAFAKAIEIGLYEYTSVYENYCNMLFCMHILSIILHIYEICV